MRSLPASRDCGSWPSRACRFDRGTHGRNHQFCSWSFLANSRLRSTAGVAAALASRSKLSASSKTAVLAPGSVNCPATSRACSARLSHSKASFNIDSIWSSLSSFVPCPFRSQDCVCATRARSQLTRKPRANPCPRAQLTEAASRRALLLGRAFGPHCVALHLGEIAQDDRWEKQRSGRMVALHCRSRAGPVPLFWASEGRRLVMPKSTLTMLHQQSSRLSLKKCPYIDPERHRARSTARPRSRSASTFSSFRIPKPTVRGSLAFLVHRPLWRYGIVLGRLL